MKLPFAVYTARDGYAWQSGTEAGTGKLERLRKAIGKMPEFDFGDSASSGMLNVGDDIVLYRFMRQENADSHGRAASYLAMTFFPRDDARFINADAILSASPFSAPLKNPPSLFDFSGIPAIPSDFSLPTQSSTGCFDQSGAMAAAGFVFSKPIKGSLHISRREPQSGKGSLFQYSVPATEKRQTLARQPTPLGRTYEASATATIIASKWKLLAIAAGMLVLIETLALVYLIRERIHNETSQTESLVPPSSATADPPPSPTAESTPAAKPDAKSVEEPTTQPVEPPASQEGPVLAATQEDQIPTGTNPQSDNFNESQEIPPTSVSPDIKDGIHSAPIIDRPKYTSGTSSTGVRVSKEEARDE